MIRAFVALELDAALRSALAVQQFLLPLPARVPVENLHLTLCFLGEVREQVLEEAHERLADLRLRGFELELAGLGLFGGDRPRLVYVGVVANAALTGLQRKVERAARLAGIDLEARRFFPHVTLGRFRPPAIAEALRLERAVAEQGGFRAGAMAVREFVLFESHLNRNGARHEVLARYPLE